MNRLAQDEFIRSCTRFGDVAHTALSTLEMLESPVMDYKSASGFTMRHDILLNKSQLEAAFVMFPAGEDLIDMRAFLLRIKSDDPLPGTIYSSFRADSPHKCACPASCAAHSRLQHPLADSREPMRCTPARPYPPLALVSLRRSHLALSGVSTSDTTRILKPFPKHWGVPPNASLKGADGAVRELPAGYGMGNAAWYKWVKQHLERDAFANCDENGKQPYPYGNYSLGCSG